MTVANAIGQRRALAYGPLAVLVGTAAVLIEDSSIALQASGASLSLATALLLAHLLLRRFGQAKIQAFGRWPMALQLLLVASLGFGLVVGMSLILVSRASMVVLVLGAVLALAQMAYWLSAQPERPNAGMQASLLIYTASMVLPVAALFQALPVAAVWAALASVPAWHARRVMLLRSEEREASQQLLSSSIFIFVLVLAAGVLSSALLALRGQLEL